MIPHPDDFHMNEPPLPIGPPDMIPIRPDMIPIRPDMNPNMPMPPPPYISMLPPPIIMPQGPTFLKNFLPNQDFNNENEVHFNDSPFGGYPWESKNDRNDNNERPEMVDIKEKS